MKKIYILFLVVLSTNILSAQALMELQIDSPMSIQGDYYVRHAAFGHACDTSLSGEIAFIDDGTSDPLEGCSPAQNDLTGKIAFIDRGSCNFSLKAWNAQEAGAIAVVICNNNPNGTILMTPGLHGDEITVHTVSLSQEDCNVIRAQVPGATATLKLLDPVDERTPVVWSEDFNDGMDGWTTTTENMDDEIFYWSDEGFTTFQGLQVSIGMPNSYCTGAVGFPSGWYQTGKTGIDSLAAPGPPYPDYYAELISPIIDLSGQDKVLSLKFDQRLRWLNPNSGSYSTFVAYSIDGGETFSNAIAVNTEVEQFERITNTVKVNIPEIEGHSNVKIKFIYAVDYYYWIIDNVRLVEREDNNLGITSFYAIPPYTQIPISQVDPIYFVGDFHNSGALTQENIKFNVNVSKDGNQLVFEEKEFDSLESDSSIVDEIFTKNFTPTENGIYSGKYTVSADAEDFDDSDNTKEFSFEVTENIYAKETGGTRRLRPADRAWSSGNPHSWAIGNVFHIVSNKDAEGKPLVCENLIIGVSNPSVVANQSILAFLYKWVDANNDGDADPGELTEIGAKDYDFTGNEENKVMIEFKLEDSVEDGDEVLNLESNTDYIALVQYVDETPENDADDIFYEASEAYDYRAQIFLNTPTDVVVSTSPGVVNFGFGIGEPRYGTVVGILDDPDGFFNDVTLQTNFFRLDITPVIRMKIGVDPNYTGVEALTLDNKMDIYPNPTSDIVNVQIDLVEQVKNARINIVDMAGRVIFSKSYSNLLQGDFQFNIGNLSDGVYQLNLVTDKGVRTNKFVVSH